MTPAEYVQLKAFARQDGALLAVLWTASFACYVAGFAQSVYGLLALLLIATTPVFVWKRLRRFRDEDRQGVISLMRGWAFVILVFFYASILLAVALYVYFAYMDRGYLLSSIGQLLASAEGQQALQQYGMQDAMAESLAQMSQMRPIDTALNVLTMNILVGIVLGLPIAAVLQRAAPIEQ